MRTFSDMRGANWSVGSLARRPNPDGLYVVADAGIISKGEQGVASPRKFAGLRYGTGTTGMHQHREGWGGRRELTYGTVRRVWLIPVLGGQCVKLVHDVFEGDIREGRRGERTRDEGRSSARALRRTGSLGGRVHRMV